jgi:hypothetical protein
MLTLHLRCTYASGLAGGGARAKAENFPLRLHAFGTHELRRERPQVFVFESSAVDAQHRPARPGALDFEVALEWRGVADERQLYAPLRDLGAYTFADVDRRFEPGRVSRAARFVINAYATTQNKERQRCFVRAGCTVFTVDDLVRALDGAVLTEALVQNAADVQPKSRERGDVLRTDPPLLKGTVTVQRAWLTGGTQDDLLRSLLPASPAFDLLSTEQMRDAGFEMNALIDRNMNTFFGPSAPLSVPSIPALGPFHAPVSERDQFAIATFGYALNRAPHPPPLEFFIEQVRIVSGRRGQAPAWVARTLTTAFDAAQQQPSRADLLGALSFGAALLTTLANALVYIDDFVNRNRADEPWDESKVEPDEDNKIARAVGGDDCEGLALECMMLAADLYFDGDKLRSGAPRSDESDALAAVMRVLPYYVPGQMFGAVTNAKLTYGGAATMTRADTLAHTFFALIPFDRVVVYCPAELARRLQATKRWQWAAGREAAFKRLALPWLISEGTAIVDATMLPIDSYYEDRNELAKAVRLSERRSGFIDELQDKLTDVRLQTEMLTVERADAALASGQRDLSAFYKWVNGFSTSAFAEALVFDFAFYYERSARGKAYGVRFNDIMKSRLTPSELIRMMPTAVLTQREAAVLDNIMALEEPVPCLASPKTAAVIGAPDARAALAELVADRRPPMPSTAAHRSRMLVTGRAADIGPGEIAALRRIASMDWASISVEWRRVAAFDLTALEPIEVVDIVLQY